MPFAAASDRRPERIVVAPDRRSKVTLGQWISEAVRGRRLSGAVVGAIGVPLLLFVGVAWQDRVAVFHQAEQRAQSTAAFYMENAHNLFTTHELVATAINNHIESMSWEDIATSKDLDTYLASLVKKYPQVHSLYLVDKSGQIRNSSAGFPMAPVDVADRDYFKALRETDSGTYVGHVVPGRVYHDNFFNVARRRTSKQGVFDGVIVVSASPSYFSNFWQTTAPDLASHTALLLPDDTLLARVPPIDFSHPSPPHPFMDVVARGDEAALLRILSPYDKVERITAIRRVANFPLYVEYGVSVESILQIWLHHLLIYAVFFAVATSGLVWLALLAQRNASNEMKALRRLAAEAEMRTAIERQLRQAHRIEALGQLAGGVAHDFGNLVQIIIGNLGSLRQRPAEAGDPRVIVAAEAAERSAKLVQSLLSFGREKPALTEIIDLNVVLQGFEDMLRQASGPRIKFAMRLTPPACWVRADRNDIEMAVLNLTVNARDAMPQGGTLTISTEIMHLTAEQPHGLTGVFCAITVADSGIGMPPEVAAQAFQSFFTTKGIKGTGLGLSMVHGFAQQTGGNATIRSAPGRGTTVTIYLPYLPLCEG